MPRMETEDTRSRTWTFSVPHTKIADLPMLWRQSASFCCWDYMPVKGGNHSFMGYVQFPYAIRKSTLKKKYSAKGHWVYFSKTHKSLIPEYYQRSYGVVNPDRRYRASSIIDIASLPSSTRLLLDEAIEEENRRNCMFRYMDYLHSEGLLSTSYDDEPDPDLTLIDFSCDEELAPTDVDTDVEYSVTAPNSPEI